VSHNHDKSCSHDHTSHNHSHGVVKNLTVAFLLNASFTIIQLIGGIYTGSTMLISEAIHDLGDTISLGISVKFEKLANKKHDAKYTFGYQRFSILAAFINSITLVCFSLFIVIEAMPKIFDTTIININTVVWLAVLGIIFNGLAVLRTLKASKWNEKVVNLHLMEDFFGWVVVLITGVIINYTSWYILDPIVSIILALIIAYSSIKNVIKISKILLQSTPDTINNTVIMHKIYELSEIVEIHDLHFWTMDETKTLASLHIVTNDYQESLRDKIDSIMQNYGVDHCVIQIELIGEECRYKLSHH
jgi:cobalt-zinc-cadmium efflux system protein